MSSNEDARWTIPDGWCWTTFSNVATIASKLVSPKEWGDLPHIAPDNIERDTGRLLPYRTIAEDAVTSPKHLFRPRQILYSKIRPYLNKCVRVDFEGLCSADMYPLDAKIETAYLHFYILSRQFVSAVGEASGSRTVLPKTNQEQLSEVPVPVAPIEEQRRIAETLETHFTRLDNAVATLERVERNVKRYRASVLKAAVEGRLVPTAAALAKQAGRSYEPASVLLDRILAERCRRWSESGRKGKYQEPAPPDTSTLPDLPEGWCWATVDQLAAVGTGATPRRGDDRFWKHGTIPWVTSSAVNERRVVGPSELVTEAALAETNLTLYSPGTLLLAMYGEGKTRGMIAELAIEAATNQALAAIVLEGGATLLRSWLLVFFLHNYMELRRAASGGVQPNLNLSIVRALVVPLPPAEEQRRITSEVESMLSLVESLGKVVTTQHARSTTLRQSILRWAFEGKLRDRDPDDEPASVLLERIEAEREPAAPSRPPRAQRGTRKKQVRA